MFRGYRSALIAAGFAVVVSLAHSQEKPDTTLEGQPITEPSKADSANADEANATGKQGNTPDYTSALHNIESAIRDLITDVDEIERERNQQREIDDLHAQREMAFWAEAMFWATLGGVIVTAVGVTLVGFTLHHTKRAADYAKDMVAEAENTTSAALRAVQTERAWVSFVQVQVGTDGDAVGFAICWKNAGRSPAIGLQMYVSHCVQNRGEAEILEFDRPAPNRAFTSTPFGPGMERMTKFCNLNPEESRLWANGSLKFVLYSWVGYRDTYSDDPRHTEICCEVEFLSEKNGQYITSAKPYGHQNTGS